MGIYHIIGGLLKTALGFYFRRIERFGLENVPLTGPVLFASNHPNSLTDAFVVGAAVPRKVQFLATIQLFKFKPLAWLLAQAGVIPVNRAKDKASAMRSVLATFEAVYKVLESGGAVGILAFGAFYSPLIYCVHRFWGWPASLFYALSLPVAGLVAHYYLKSAGRLVGSLRGFAVLARMRMSVPRILFLRKSLIRDIEIHRRAYREQASP